MNKLPALLILIAILSLPQTVSAAPMGYALQVDGLACPFCAYGVEKKLNSIEGVEDIQVDIEKGQVIVMMSEGSPLSENSAREQVEKAGFTLRAFTQLNEVK